MVLRHAERATFFGEAGGKGMADGLVLVRPIRPEDAEAAGVVAHEAHATVSAAHNFPSEHPSLQFSVGMIGAKVKDRNAAGFVAERDGRILGSIFLNTFPPAPVAAIGPMTVAPQAEGDRVGRKLMQAALDEAATRKIEQVRLVQSPSHLRSLALYTKLGFDVREPLLMMQGKPSAAASGDHIVRPAEQADIAACEQLCTAIHGFARGAELRGAIDQRVASVVMHRDRIVGYSTGLGFRGHSVAETTEALKALIGGATALPGPGFFVPTRNGELLRWLFAQGLRAVWPAMLMTRGAYQDPKGAFLPSIAF
jgi:GNAT superfamily N-acetyltransferase